MVHRIGPFRRGLLAIGVISIAIPLLYISYKIFTAEGSATTITIDWHPMLFYLAITYYVLLIGLFLGYALNWFIKQIRSIIDLKHEKTKTELLHLKSQISPHFFFNILNNLYGLVDSDSKKAKELILKLSDMMRYSIYKGQEEMVSIKEEVDFIHNFIALHRMRYHNDINVTFDTDVSNEQLKIMPLLFIVLVENAFKHGVEVLGQDAFVSITLKVSDSTIYFETKNNFNPKHKTAMGIGLRNLSRRLALVYPKRHHFSTTTIHDTFKTQLKVQL